MKKNYNIMSKPKISDEEIEKLMDFDGLMKAYSKTVPIKNKFSVTKGMIASGIVVIIAISLYLFLNIEAGKEVRQETPPIDGISKPAETLNPEVKATTDQSLVNELPIQVPKAKEQKLKSNESPVAERKVIPNQDYVGAEPIGGFPTLYSYFDNELEYPKEAVNDSIQGVESVSFVIDKEGRTTSFEFLNSLGAPFDKEVMRLLKEMPLWKPATLNGKPVVSKVSVPFSFRIKTIHK
jgi:TonB family protein